ncbi:MAG: hypothetical protein ACXWBM_07120 [Chthoniobacterales bacterium]
MTDTPAYYFSLPRLLAKWRGRSAARTENNWREANIVGLCFHIVVYLFAFRLLLAGCNFWLILLLPLAFLVWICWLLFFYFASLLTKLLRTIGFMRELSDGRAQSVIIGTATVVCAGALVFDRAPFNIIGIAWLVIVALNLLAAVILKSNVSAAE